MNSLPEKKTWIDYLIYLFWLFLAFTIIYDLFNVSVRSFYWLMALTISLVIYRKNLIPKPIYLFMAVMFVFQIFGELYFGFFYTIPHYDKVDHLLSGIEFCVLFYYALDKKISDKRLLVLFAFLFSLSFEYLWELVEYISDTYLGTTMVGVVLRSPGEYVDSAAKIIMSDYLDTIYDMAYSFFGSVAFALSALFLLRKKEKINKKSI